VSLSRSSFPQTTRVTLDETPDGGTTRPSLEEQGEFPWSEVRESDPFHQLGGLMLIRLFQEATISSVGACRARRFREMCASFSVSSAPKRRVGNT
jgi:hypothetical protein